METTSKGLKKFNEEEFFDMEQFNNDNMVKIDDLLVCDYVADTFSKLNELYPPSSSLLNKRARVKDTNKIYELKQNGSNYSWVSIDERTGSIESTVANLSNRTTTLESKVIVQFIATSLSDLTTRYPASATYLNKKCLVTDTNAIYKCVEISSGSYAWIKEIESIINITYNNLKALKDSNKLIAGQQYRITDFVTIVNDSLTEYSSANHPFDMVVVANSNNTICEDARACLHDGDTYFASQKLYAWKIKYCFDNDVSRFDWATSNGKGVIWELEDEYNNICSYDFKNVLRKVYKVSANTKQTDRVGRYFAIRLQGKSTSTNPNDTINTNDYKYCYTFNLSEDNYATCSDSSIANGSKSSQNNNISCIPVSDSATQITLQSNIFLIVNEGAYYNKLSQGCANNIFGEAIYHTLLGNGSQNNSFGNTCYNNSFGNPCYNNSFGNNCCNNSFKNDCSNNSFGNSCYHNSFDNNCHNNSFGNFCSSNSIDNDCSGNSFGNYLFACHLENYCQNNKLGTNILASGWKVNQAIKIAPNCQNLVFNNTSATGGVSNIHIAKAGKSNVTYTPSNNNSVITA